MIPIAFVPAPWAEYALCAQVDGNLWFPEHGESAEPAKEICRQCPVRAECLEDAMRRKEPHGVWGGLSEPQRRRLREKRRAA